MNDVVTELADLRSDPSCLRGARERLRDILRRLDMVDETIAVAELALSELVTNAVVHGAPPVTMSIEVTDTEVTVGVSDAGTARPHIDEIRLDATGGRGLAIVAAVAARWGHDADGARKRVWFAVAR